MRIIPAIDLKDGKCVRLLKGDFAKTTEYSSDPAAIGRQFSALAVSDLHIVDLDGARSGEQSNHEIVADIARHSGLSVQLGGGIRDLSDAERWLAAGVERCVIGSIAIKDPQAVTSWIKQLGSDAIVLALDVRIDSQGTPLLTTDGWTQTSATTLWDCLDAYRSVDARHVLCTDVSRDGALSGPNLELYDDILARYPGTLLQASGGVRDIADLCALRDRGLPAAITGRALLDGAISETEIASFQQNA